MIEVAPQIRRHGVGNCVLKQIDIALILLACHLGPDFRCVCEVGFRLIEELGNLLGAGDDVAQALGLRSVFQRQRVEQRVTDQFHVDGGIMPVALNRVELEQSQFDLALHDVGISAIFG